MKNLARKFKPEYFRIILIALILLPAISRAQSTYYISSNGNDSNSGTSVDSPWKTIKKINSFTFQPSDKILFKKGEEFSDKQLIINSNGKANQEIIFGTYGEGNKPIIGSKSLNETPVVLISGEFVIFENFIVQAGSAKPKAGGILVNASNSIVRNNNVIGGQTSHEGVSGISISKGSNYVLIDNNSVKGFGNGIVGYECLHTTISNNKVHDIWRTNGTYQSGGWGIRLIGNNFPYGFDFKYTSKITNNEIFDFERYAIDCALSSRVIIEYNEIHSPLPPSYGGTNGFGSGIKAGEKNAKTKDGTVGNIVRYNKIYNLKGSPTTAWLSNNGIETVNSEDGWIYGNLIYDIDGSGVTRTGLDNFPYKKNLSWRIYNNTIISSHNCIYIEVRTTSPTYISNNILSCTNNNNSAIMAKQDIYEGNNLYVGRSGISNNESSSNKLAVYQRYGSTFTQGDKSFFDSNPGFEDLNSKNFMLKSDSKCINMGIDVGKSEDGNPIRGQDIAGNFLVDRPDIGAFEFGGTEPPPPPPAAPTVNNLLMVYLEGPFVNNKMETILKKKNSIPFEQPYNVYPWNLNDNSTNISEVNIIVDWIIVELRSSETKVEYSKAGLLTQNAIVLNSNGNYFSFSNITSGQYFIVIRHRNHLDIMSSLKVEVQNEVALNYDFTTSQAMAFGANALADLGNGKYGMFSGDADADGLVNNLDFGMVANGIPNKGYSNNDLDMNGTVNVLDYNKINKNILKGSQVPQ